MSRGRGRKVPLVRHIPPSRGKQLSPQLSQRLIRLKKGGEQEESSVEVTLYATRESSSTRMRRIEGTFISMSIHVYIQYSTVIAVQSLSMPMFMSCCCDAVRRGRLNDVTNVSRHGTVIGRERQRESVCERKPRDGG